MGGVVVVYIQDVFLRQIFHKSTQKKQTRIKIMSDRFLFFVKSLLPGFLLLTAFSAFAQTADVLKGCSPLSVNFTAPSGSTSWYWDFNDGGSSVLQNPSNIFITPGNYQVAFRSTPNGPVVGTVQIEVWPKPEVMFTATPATGCLPLNVHFQDNSTVQGDILVLNRSWVFGDGGSASGLPNPVHLYNSAGNFGVSLELTTNYPSCNITALFPDKVKTLAKPLVAFTTNPNPPQACTPPLNVSFTNNTTGQGPLSYTWTFGNGNSSPLSTPPAQNYTQTGVFPVRLKATNSLGCADSVTINVRIGNPAANFTLSDTTPCVQVPVFFLNNGDPGQYSWNFGPNAVPGASTLFNPQVTFTTPGVHPVTLTVTSAGGCTGTFTKNVVVDKADASFAVVPDYACTDPAVFQFNPASPVAIQWVWDLPYNTFSNIKNPTYTWTNPDTTGYSSLGPFRDSVLLIVANPSGCIDSVRQLLTVWRPNARFVPTVMQGCAPVTTVFQDKSFSNEAIVEWHWSFGDGSPDVVANNGGDIQHTYNQPGEYEVRLSIRNAAGCTDTSYAVVVRAGDLLSADFTADKTQLCPGDTVQFEALITDSRIQAWHFYSDDDRQWHCQQNQQPSWVYETNTGTMDVSLMVEYNGCFNTITKQDLLTLNGPIARLHYKTTCDNTLLFDFQDESSGATSVSWSLGDSTISTSSQLSHLYQQPGTYQVILTAEHATSGCPASSDTATVYATQLQSDFSLPYYICGGQEYWLDGNSSLDVNASCYKGYTWYFSFQRPIRTDEGIIPFMFTASGDQTVALEVQDINGCYDTLQQDVRVFFVHPKFEMNDSLICLPGTVQFTDLSVGDTTLTSWSWDFGDGTPLVSVQNPTHTYLTPPPPGQDYYEVILRVTDRLGCSHEVKRSIRHYTPVSNIVASPTANTCVGKNITLSGTDYTAGGSHLMWQWDFGDGQSAPGQTVTHAFAQHGAYTVTVTYTEVGSGCTAVSTRNVNIHSYPNAAFTTNVDNQSIICYPQNIQMLNASVSDYPTSATWNLGNGQIAFGNTAATVFPKGTFSVTMIAATAYGCADTVSRSFTVVGPEGAFDMDKTAICLGDAVLFTLKDTVDISSFSWSFGDGTTVDNISPVTHQYSFFPPSGSTVVKLILKGEDDACSFTVSKPLNFSKVNADFTLADDPVCLGNEHVFVNQSIEDDVWQWQFGDGSASVEEQPMHEYDETGTYVVTLIVTDQPLGCRDTVTQSVEVSGIPNFEAVGATICQGDTATIGLVQPVPGATYTWTPAGGILPPANQPVIKVRPSATTIYTVAVTIDSSGCMDMDTALVTVPGGFTGAQNLDTLVEKGQTVTLPIQILPGYVFTWSPQSPPGNLQVTPQDSSLHYYVTITDPWGCVETPFEFHVRVFPQELMIPNAFTPGGGDANEVFKLLPDGEPGLIEINYLKIYNRWGQLIYEGSGPDDQVGWDGTYKGAPAPMDVYIWKASATYKTGRVEQFAGEVTLLR